MSRIGTILCLALVTALSAIGHAGAQVATTMTTDWVYNEPVIASGENLDGDEPLYNKLCIAPATNKTNKTCYDPDDDADGLVIEKWTEGSLTFSAPADIPVRGVVILQLRMKVQKCFGSAGCIDTTEQTEKELGGYEAAPFATDLIEKATGTNVFTLKANTTYTVEGAFFGSEKGTIFLQFPRGSKNLDPSAILSWSYDTITFKTPEGDAPTGFSVNNGVSATKYDLTPPASSSSSSASVKSSSSSSSSSSRPAEEVTELFIDIGEGHPYAAAIRWAKQSGVLQGYPDGTFGPDKIVNRAEFLKIVLGAKGDVSVDGEASVSGFSDVDVNAWYAPFVGLGKTRGIIQGYADGTFKPEQAVNFAEALKMAYNALEVFTPEADGEWYQRFLQHALANDVLFTSTVNMDEGMSRKDVVWIAWRLMTSDGGSQAPSPSSSSQASSESTSAAERFTDGTFVVGTEIEPGTYRTRKGSSGCYYARLSGFSNELEDILANEFTNASSIVTIEPTDVGFKSSGCGTWTQDMSAITTSKTSFGDGTFLIDTDIEPGTYKSTTGSSCYYARLSGFSGQIDDIIANEFTDESVIVTISSSDTGFRSSGCGTWKKMD